MITSMTSFKTMAHNGTTAKVRKLLSGAFSIVAMIDWEMSEISRQDVIMEARRRMHTSTLLSGC